MSNLKYGCLPAVRPFGLSTLSTYATGKLPQPPAKVDAPSGVKWGMDLNDRLGICTVAGADHLLAAWNAEFGASDPRPNEATLEATYYRLTGGADSGCVEARVLQRWHSVGLFGNKIAGYAPIQPTNLVEIHQSIAFYGGVYLGIACPESAQEDFAHNKPWRYDPTSPIEGGHCVVGVGYTHSSLLCVSWGALVEVTYPFLAHFCSEAWTILSQELVEKGSDALHIDLKTLQADLASI